MDEESRFTRGAMDSVFYSSYGEKQIYDGGFDIERLIAISRRAKDLSKFFIPRPGCFACEMDEVPSRHGSLLLPDNFRNYTRPDRGCVVARGEGVGLEPGDIVYVHGHKGTWYDRFKVGEKEISHFRVYGIFGSSWEEDVYAVYRASYLEECFDKRSDKRSDKRFDNRIMNNVEDLTIIGSNILVKKDEVPEREGNFYLPDTVRESTVTGIGTVVKVGHRVKDVPVGSKVIYSIRDVKNFRFSDKESYGVIDIDKVWGIVKE